MQYTMLFFLVLVAIATSSTAIASREWPYGYKMPKWIQNIQNATAPDQSDISEESKELDISLSESKWYSDILHNIKGGKLCHNVSRILNIELKLSTEQFFYGQALLVTIALLMAYLFSMGSKISHYVPSMNLHWLTKYSAITAASKW